MTAIDEAIKLLQANGYRVTKPKPKKISQRGPTFVATFADGEQTRMTTFCVGALDWGRGERVAQAAWQSRRKRHGSHGARHGATRRHRLPKHTSSATAWCWSRAHDPNSR